MGALYRSWMPKAPQRPAPESAVDLDVFQLIPQSATSQPRMPRSASQAHLGSQILPPHNPVASTLAMLNDILSSVPASMHLDRASVACDHLVASTAHWEVHYGFYNHRPVAIKTLPTDSSSDTLGRASELVAFAREVRVMAAISHPNIVAFIGFVWLPDDKADVMSAVAEYMPQGTLASFLADNGPMQWRLKASLALDVALALQYLHFVVHPAVIHRSLTSKNILVEWPHVKLSCFGLSRLHCDDAAFVPDKHHLYSAPEVLCSDASQTSIASDMYSFGCLLAELDTQAPLYANLRMPPEHIVYKVVRNGLRPTAHESCPEPIRSLMDMCLATAPTDRPTAMDAVHHLQAMLRSEIGQLV
ncbi:hypothetical protein DYB32_006805 [Aphanomyces invadans]|uniref:Protein kinase domain-containing protein n=1 Tax=Aphanomyces invadans TaxID=157072 RepID=A0A3R6VYF3_9STRA|nr:hypothetical protein DYB32_006805 [Aphanomyces invadans]